MGLFKKKTEKEKLYSQYRRLLEQAKKMSTVNRTESDRLTAEANALLDRIDKLPS